MFKPINLPKITKTIVFKFHAIEATKLFNPLPNKLKIMYLYEKNILNVNFDILRYYTQELISFSFIIFI